MKKKLLTLFLVAMLPIMAIQAAMVTFHWVPPKNGDYYNGSPIVAIKIYYGGELRNYTNSVVTPITNKVVTTPYYGYELDACISYAVSNYIEIPIGGLILGSKIYTAQTLINARGEETPYLGHATCGYTITNNNDLVSQPKPKSPTNLNVK